jgi:DNA polymerase
MWSKKPSCALWRNATQTVFDERPRRCARRIVGREQPGDQEDLSGHPFVGPAGRLLDRALAQAGLDRRTSYVTKAVKHFKFEPRGNDGCTRNLSKSRLQLASNGCIEN